MVHFDTVYMAPRVRVALNSIFEPQYAKKFWSLVDKLKAGQFGLKGLNVEKLHTKRGKVFSARLNKEIRVIFSMFARGDKRSMVIWDANHHDDAYDRVDRASVPLAFQDISMELEPVASWGESGRSLDELAAEASQADDEALTDGLLLFEVPHYVLSEPNRYNQFEKNIDRYLRLTEEQEGLIERHDKAYLVQGSAGTGKTTLALFHALNLYERNPEDDVFFFTYQEELACVCRCYKVNLVGDDGEEEKSEQGGLRVFSYIEFCKHYLRKHLDSTEIKWQWIDKQDSLDLLDEIIRSKSRWSRSIQADDTYSYIYSILKGRFVPGTDRFPENEEDYKRIFKGYGSTPKNLEEVMEIFQVYESRLQKSNKRDEADLIRHCYNSMKDSALLSGEKRATWIVMDEIQDFTELEWKSILLFWDNKCRVSKAHLSFPFLSGDRNQNISRSGFRWQEVDSYIDGILKRMHRPNALEKMHLHNNFRNTVEIFNLGKFIRECAPEGGGDIGTPPKFSSGKPLLVIGEEKPFVDFLHSVCGAVEDQLPAPLVVLYESEADLKGMKRGLPLDDGVFLMPLRKSKGMEFEDCILFRLFGSIAEFTEDTGEDLIARLFDLWYMSVTRARKNLLIYMQPSDWEALCGFIGDKSEQLLNLVEIRKDPAAALREFYDHSEKYIPNYNVIFLERVKAQEAWDEWSHKDGIELSKPELEARKEQALRLWKKCRDWPNLGKAYKALGSFAEAIRYLKLANMPREVAYCYEQLADYQQAALHYEEAQDLQDAIRCHESYGNRQRAAELAEVIQDWVRAAENYAESGDSKKAALCYEKAEKWEEAASLYRLRAEWLKAAELFSKIKQWESAAEMYLKVKDKLDAARCYMSAGQLVKAAALLESLNRWGEAADCYVQAEQFDKAGPLYAKAGRLKDVAICAEKSGDLAKAAAAFERMKNWAKAAEIYLALGAPQKAADCFESGEEFSRAAPLLEKAKQWLRAGRSYEKAGDFASAANCFQKVEALNEAAYCYEKLDRLEDAVKCYVDAKNFSSAASIYTRQGRRMEAARLFLTLGQLSAAMELTRAVPPDDPSTNGKSGDLRLELALWAEQNGRFDLAGGVYEHVGQLMLAANRYKQAMLLGKAALCFERDKKLALAADLYSQDGQFEKAAICFRALKNWQRAAESYEQARMWAEAKEMYERCGNQEGVTRCLSSSQWL